jgi:predicted nucleic acid-binding protein
MTSTGVSRFFIDTNILIYATNTASPWHSVAAQLLQDSHFQGTDMNNSPQIVREYLAAATRPAPQILPLPMVLANVQAFHKLFHLVEDDLAVSMQLVQLMIQVTVGGNQVHVANIVATMQTHSIQHLLTHNTADFNRFSQLITIIPLVQP